MDSSKANLSNEIIKNSYVRATLVVLALTILAGLLQANINGPLWILFFSALNLGMFLLIILLIVSLVSVIRNHSKFIDDKVAMNSTPENKKSIDYKKRILWCLILAVPGVMLYLYAVISAQNGASGTEFIGLVFFPLFLLSIITIPAALVYGIIYLIKKKLANFYLPQAKLKNIERNSQFLLCSIYWYNSSKRPFSVFFVQFL